MGIFACGASILRRTYAAGAAKTRVHTAKSLYEGIIAPLRALDGGSRSNEAAWDRYGSNSVGSYDHDLLLRAISMLSQKQLMTASKFLADHTGDYRAAGTVGRALIDLSNGAPRKMLDNIVALYDVLDIRELYEDYWYYPLEIISGLDTDLRTLKKDAAERTATVAVFTLVAAVSLGGLRRYVRYREDGALVLKDPSIQKFVWDKQPTFDEMRRFVEDHIDYQGDFHLAVVEGYFDKDTPVAFRDGYL